MILASRFSIVFFFHSLKCNVLNAVAMVFIVDAWASFVIPSVSGCHKTEPCATVNDVILHERVVIITIMHVHYFLPVFVLSDKFWLAGCFMSIS